jgi:hypothetical protein
MSSRIWIAVAAVAASVAAVAPAAGAERCLEWRQIKSTHMVDQATMTVTTNRNVRYTVRFTGACKVGKQYSWNHFVTTDLMRGHCLEARDVLPTSSLGPCVVASVEKQAS